MWPFSKAKRSGAHPGASITDAELNHLLVNAKGGDKAAVDRLIAMGASRDADIRAAQIGALVDWLLMHLAADSVPPIMFGTGTCSACGKQSTYVQKQAGDATIGCAFCRANIRLEWWRAPDVEKTIRLSQEQVDEMMARARAKKATGSS